LLGLRSSEFLAWNPPKRQQISIAVPGANKTLQFHPRKKHSIAKRFELARFIGDYILHDGQGEAWLASTDLRTSRQKYQRAFAAEFLCPLDSLQAYLNKDYSESAIEDAAEHFDVSPQTVESMLANNDLIPSTQLSNYLESLPY